MVAAAEEETLKLRAQLGDAAHMAAAREDCTGKPQCERVGKHLIDHRSFLRSSLHAGRFRQ